MELENYFEFLSENDIRLKGTRIGIETILENFLNGSDPEEIAIRYTNLSLEQVYATVTYYIHNRQKINAYLQAWRRYTEQAGREADANPPEVVKRLRRLKAARSYSPRSTIG
jgi:uncharacterized protein (DUF433 family)